MADMYRAYLERGGAQIVGDDSEWFGTPGEWRDRAERLLDAWNTLRAATGRGTAPEPYLAELAESIRKSAERWRAYLSDTIYPSATEVRAAKATYDQQAKALQAARARAGLEPATLEHVEIPTPKTLTDALSPALPWLALAAAAYFLTRKDTKP